MTQNGALAELILHAYPWWEMMRVRQIAQCNLKNPLRIDSNEWLHSPGLIDHKHRGVTTPNCDTLYSSAWLDLSVGPVLIQVPKTDLSYWSVAVMDLNTDNIAMMGSLHGSTQALLVCHQSYAGALPQGLEGVPCVRSQSQVVWLLARFLIGTDALLAQAQTVQAGLRLSRADAQRQAAQSPPPEGLPRAIRKDAANFWEVIQWALQEDSHLRSTLPKSIDSQLGWANGDTHWAALSSEFQVSFTHAFEHVLKQITTPAPTANRQWRSCWRYPMPGIGNFGTNALNRAETALWGLGALEISEVVYASCFKDSQEKSLKGEHQYRFQIPKQGIPARAFWSLTMYEIDPKGGLYFTDNPLGRYAIGDRTPDLLQNADGTIDIIVSHTPPPAELQTHWLPAPAGYFCLMLRAYAPSDALQTGQDNFPAVLRVES